MISASFVEKMPGRDPSVMPVNFRIKPITPKDPEENSTKLIFSV